MTKELRIAALAAAGAAALDGLYAVFLWAVGNRFIDLPYSTAETLMRAWAVVHYLPERLFVKLVLSFSSSPRPMDDGMSVLESVIYYFLCIGFVFGVALLLAFLARRYSVKP